MIKVGLTGGIGSGKTTIARFFELLNIPVYYSDTAAKSLMINNLKIKQQLSDLLGSDVYLGNGELNKTYISSKIFTNSAVLKQVNEIVHPFVEEDFYQFCETHRNQKYIIKESAILIETGLYKKLDKMILITANIQDRIQRVALRDRLSQEQIQEKINKQLSDSDKILYSDFQIQNDNQQLLIPQVLKIHHQIITTNN